MTTYAGLYGPEALIDSSGHAITSAVIDVFTHGTTTHVSLYQDNARGTPLSNPVPNGVDGSTAGRGLDTFGNLSFYVDPGRYDLRIATGAGTRTVEIEVETDPAENAASSALESGSSHVYTVTGSGDETAGIQAVLTAAKAAGSPTKQQTVIVIGGTATVGGSLQANGAALSIGSYTTLVLWDAYLKLGAGVKRPILMNENPVPTGAVTDKEIKVVGIGNAGFDGNAANNASSVVFSPPYYNQWHGVPVFFVGVTNPVVQDVAMKNPTTWGISFQNTDGLRALHINGTADGSTLNQSPVTLYGANTNFVIDGIYGNSGDDAVALLTYTLAQAGAAGYPNNDGTFPGGDIAHGVVRNVRGTWATVEGTTTRLLCGDGFKIYDVQFSHIQNTNQDVPLVIFGQDSFVGTPAAAGDCYDISYDDCHGCGGNAGYILIGQSCANLRFSGLSSNSTSISKFLRNSGNHSGAQVLNLAVHDAQFPNFASGGVLVELDNTISVNGLTLDGIRPGTLTNILHNAATITNASISNIDVVVAYGPVFNSSVAEVGYIDNVHVHSRNTGVTTYYAATAMAMTRGPNMPIPLAGTDVLPTGPRSNYSPAAQAGHSGSATGAATVSISASGGAGAFAAVAGTSVTVKARAGDRLLLAANGTWDAASGALARLDVATIVSAAAVNFASTGGAAGTSGVIGWSGLQGVYLPIGGPVLYTVQAGDVVSGQVTVQLYSKVDSAGPRNVFSPALAVLNLG